MESGPLSTPEFAEFARDVVLFTHITSRIPGEKHANLLQEKGGRGFPHLVVMDAEGQVLATHEGPRTVEAFRATTRKARRYVELKAVKDPTPAQRADLFLAELDLGRLDLAAARQRRGELTGLTPEQEAQVAAAITDLEIVDMAKSLGPRPTPAQRAELGGRYHAMLQEGRRPGGEEAFQPFYILMLDWAEKEKDAAAFEQALAALRERFGSQPGVDRFFKAQEERLARIKAQ